MTVLYITELTSGSLDAAGRALPAACLPAVAEQTVTFTTTSVQSAVLNSATSLIRLHADGNCSVAIGTNPTATTANMRLAAGAVEYFGVKPGTSLRVAAINN